MRKILLLLLLVNYAFHSMALERNFPDSIVNPPKKTVYNFNKQPSSCVDNLENLFQAWPINNIVNAKEVELISYTSYGAIRDTAQLIDYAYLSTQWDSPFLSTSGYMSSERKGHFFKFREETSCKRIYELHALTDAENVAKALNDELLMRRQGLISLLKIGYRVFSIKLKYQGEIMENYIFFDPESFEVVFDPLFGSISF